MVKQWLHSCIHWGNLRKKTKKLLIYGTFIIKANNIEKETVDYTILYNTSDGILIKNEITVVYQDWQHKFQFYLQTQQLF